MDSSVCHYCFKKFHDSSSKNRHTRKIHSVEIDIKPKISHIICPKCPDDNKQSFASYILLMSHISDDHKIVIKQETIKFTTKEDFENWRALEKRSVNYTKQNVVHKINTTITYYNCNRSNSHGHQSTCSTRTLKREGSIKINGVCPSRIIAHHDNHSGEVEVNFVETHVGHSMDFRSQRLTIEEENKVVAKLKAGVSTERIIRDARKFNEGELNRYNLLSKQDLTNYRAKHNIANKRDSNDMVAVTIKVQEWNSSGKNYAFLYKKIGDPHPKLENKDFALGFMNNSMETKLKDYSRIICMDGTHGTNNKKFDLTIMMVKDNQDMGFPVAFFLSNRQDQAIQEVFLEALKERVEDEIKPEFFMTDDDKKYHNAWTKIMGNTPRRLLCAWHVRKNWNHQKKKIKNENLRNTMNAELEKIMVETNEETFWNLTTNYFNKLEDANETNFMNYLKRFYFIDNERIQMWAYCHRLYAGINTNMALESFNKTLKDLLQRNAQSTLEKLLDTIDEAVEGKIWNTICNRYRPTSNNNKSRKISKAHRIAEGCNVNEFVEVEEFGKFKVKSSTGEKFYSVLYYNAGVCNCEGIKCNVCSICMHTYKCECVEYAVKNTICKHAHMVSMYERGVVVGSVLDEDNQDKENLLCNVEESEEKLKSNEAIAEFIEEKCATLNDGVNLNLQENMDKDTRKKIIIESWRSSTLNYLDDFYNWDDASFEKLVPQYNSFLNKISQHQSIKRKMEKQTYFPNKQQKRE